MKETKKEMLDFLYMKIERAKEMDLGISFHAGMVSAYESIIFNIENDMIKDYSDYKVIKKVPTINDVKF